MALENIREEDREWIQNSSPYIADVLEQFLENPSEPIHFHDVLQTVMPEENLPSDPMFHSPGGRTLQLVKTSIDTFLEVGLIENVTKDQYQATDKLTNDQEYYAEVVESVQSLK
jgi:methyltransferase-like protein